MEHQLNGELVAALAAAGPDEKRLRQAMGILRDCPGGLRRLLDPIATDQAAAARVARDSYLHANGFAKLVLQRGADPAYKLRLHVWSEGVAAATLGDGGSNRHTHRWAFSSIVLCGALTVEEFEELGEADGLGDPKASRCNKLAYDSPTADTAGGLRPLGECWLRPTGSATYAAGDTHGATLETIHRVAPMGMSPTATLVMQGPTRAPFSNVYEVLGEPAHDDTSRRAITTAETMELVALVTATLDL